MRGNDGYGNSHGCGNCDSNSPGNGNSHGCGNCNGNCQPQIAQIFAENDT